MEEFVRGCCKVSQSPENMLVKVTTKSFPRHRFSWSFSLPSIWKHSERNV